MSTTDCRSRWLHPDEGATISQPMARRRSVQQRSYLAVAISQSSSQSSFSLNITALPNNDQNICSHNGRNLLRKVQLHRQQPPFSLRILYHTRRSGRYSCCCCVSYTLHFCHRGRQRSPILGEMSSTVLGIYDLALSWFEYLIVNFCSWLARVHSVRNVWRTGLPVLTFFILAYNLMRLGISDPESFVAAWICPGVLV
ncbi:hypothetical protein BDV95DRAFT_318047 [Massariosphaeria phaeospora]|uniref:Uncharacterized protein n=1 Tax=Massariosphaeria phaeospora TaxID=100035 RepID=A0A7C8ICY9_9PLEO|nr:hypothetical protein BDV95DRAFT_318047 [Massariosphaeria phaeospora]